MVRSVLRGGWVRHLEMTLNMGQCYQMGVGGDEVSVTRWVWEVMRSVLPDGCGR